MTDINTIVIGGRITRDSEMKTTTTGMAVVRFSVANGYSRKDGNEWKNESNFFDVVFIGKRAEAIFKYLSKGVSVIVSGVLRQSRWEQNGEKKSKIEILAENVQFFEKNNPEPVGRGPETFSDDDDDTIPF